MLSLKSLSGGNQQKIVLMKWLASNPDILILNCPTAGVDIGAKNDIHEIVRKAVQRPLRHGGCVELMTETRRTARETLRIRRQELPPADGGSNMSGPFLRIRRKSVTIEARYRNGAPPGPSKGR